MTRRAFFCTLRVVPLGLDPEAMEYSNYLVYLGPKPMVTDLRGTNLKSLSQGSVFFSFVEGPSGSWRCRHWG